MTAALSKGEQTRAGIVECARQLFYKHGYDGTSFSDIVEASGLVRGNITITSKPRTTSSRRSSIQPAGFLCPACPLGAGKHRSENMPAGFYRHGHRPKKTNW